MIFSDAEPWIYESWIFSENEIATKIQIGKWIHFMKNIQDSLIDLIDFSALFPLFPRCNKKSRKHYYVILILRSEIFKKKFLNSL